MTEEPPVCCYYRKCGQEIDDGDLVVVIHVDHEEVLFCSGHTEIVHMRCFEAYQKEKKKRELYRQIARQALLN